MISNILYWIIFWGAGQSEASMNKSLILVFILTVGLHQAKAEDIVVRFETHASTLYPYTSVFIAGSFNNWSPNDSSYILHAIGNDNYALELTLPDGKPVEYKYTLGAWTGVEKQSNGTDRDNRKFIATKGHIQKDTVQSWAIEAVNRGKWFLEDLTIYQINILNQEFRQEQLEANTSADFDTLIARLQSRWNREYEAHFKEVTTLNDVSIYPESITHQIGGAVLSSNVYDYVLKRESGWETNKYVFEYVFSSYWLPTFLNEYSYYAHVPSIMRLANWLPDCYNILNTAIYTPLPKTQWDKIYAVHSDIYALMDTCLSQVSLKRAGIYQVIQLLKDRLQESRNFWDIDNALYSGNTNAARASLIQYLKKDTTYKFSGGTFALKVVKRYLEEKQNEEACKTLDMLLAQTDDSFISRDTIRTYYIEADSLRGLSRYEHAVLLRHKFSLVPKDSVHKLSGTYRNILSGKDVSLDSLRGKIVLVDVWTTWCSGCRAELPSLKQFADKVKGRKDFTLLTICGDLVAGGRKQDGIKAFVTDFNLNYPVLIDLPSRSIIRDFNIRMLPTKLLFDSAGKLLMRSEDGLTIETVEAYLANQDIK